MALAMLRTIVNIILRHFSSFIYVKNLLIAKDTCATETFDICNLYNQVLSRKASILLFSQDLIDLCTKKLWQLTPPLVSSLSISCDKTSCENPKHIRAVRV